MKLNLLPNKLPYTREQIIEFIYEQQIGDKINAVKISDEKLEDGLYIPFDEHKFFGFRGGSFMSFQLYKSSNDQFYIHKNDIPHLANTYAAICILLMLGDDLERVNKQRIIDGLKYFQNEDGRIRCLVEDSEDDVRFAYCAAAVHYILTTIQGISQEPSFDAQKFIDYSKQWLSYDGGFSWVPHCESHAGLTYCTLGAFRLLDQFHQIENQQEFITEWLVSRQQMEMNGFQGRVNKIPDTWYWFWNTASLAIIDPSYVEKYVHKESIYEFIDDCSRFWGFAKATYSEYPDILHTYYSLAFMSMTNSIGFNKIDPVLAIPITEFLNFPKDKLFVET